MSRRLLLMGLNHATAPLAVREKIAFNSAQRAEALLALRQKFADAEAVLVSTCNRVELYIGRDIHAHPKQEEMAEFLAAFHGADPSAIRPHLYDKVDRDAVEHLYNVACSLDSMVLGETQILAQVRDAYEASVGSSSAGALLNPLFQRAIAAGKRVRTETAIADGRLSVASVAVDYAKQIFERFGDKTVLCIGAGKMTTLLIQHLKTLAPGKLVLTNRDTAKAQLLATQFGGEARPFEQLPDHLAAADIVASSTGSQLPIITKAMMESVMKQRRYRPLFLIDIALPRDVEESVGKMEGVYLYNLDDLQNVVSATQNSRAGAVEAARAIIAEEVQEFLAWQRQRDLGPMIEQLRQKYHSIAQGELERTLGKLPKIAPEERGHLEELARRIVNKLLHDPMQMLKHLDDQKAPAAHYLRAMERIFGLAPETEQEGETPPEPSAVAPVSRPGPGRTQESPATDEKAP